MTRTTIAGGRVPAPGFPQGLSAPARRALAAAGFARVDQLASIPASQLKRLHGIGPHAMDLLRRALAERGESFADEAPSPV